MNPEKQQLVVVEKTREEKIQEFYRHLVLTGRLQNDLVPDSLEETAKKIFASFVERIPYGIPNEQSCKEMISKMGKLRLDIKTKIVKGRSSKIQQGEEDEIAACVDIKRGSLSFLLCTNNSDAGSLTIECRKVYSVDKKDKIRYLTLVAKIFESGEFATLKNIYDPGNGEEHNICHQVLLDFSQRSVDNRVLGDIKAITSLVNYYYLNPASNHRS